jgi:hypothetical protein
MRDKMFIDKPSFPTWDKWRNTPAGRATLRLRRRLRIESNAIRVAAQIAIDQAKANAATKSSG